MNKHWKEYTPTRQSEYDSSSTVINVLNAQLAQKSIEEGLPLFELSASGPTNHKTNYPILKKLTGLVEKYNLTKLYGEVDPKVTTGVFFGEDTKFSFYVEPYNFSYNLETLNPELAKDLDSFKLEKKISLDRENRQVSIVAQIQGGYTAWGAGVAAKEFCRDHYNTETIAEYDYIVEELKKDEPFGRLAIFHGPPGTGKTHILRAIMEALDFNKYQFLFIPTELLTNAKMTQLSTLFIQMARGRKLVLLIEDAETILTPREGTGERTDAISNLLNLADGFIGNTLDMRIICTTNLKGAKIDEALVRPGRLISKNGGKPSEVRALDIPEAQALYKKLTGNEVKFAGPRTIAQIYALSKGIEI